MPRLVCELPGEFGAVVGGVPLLPATTAPWPKSAAAPAPSAYVPTFRAPAAFSPSVAAIPVLNTNERFGLLGPGSTWIVSPTRRAMAPAR